MKKKIAILACALLMTATILPSNTGTSIIAKTFNQTVQRETTNESTIWYKNQLDAYGVKMYNALETLYANGAFKEGTGEIDLTSQFTQVELKEYAGGKTTLAVAFQAARDAFCQDYAEIFYVDFSKVTLRLGMSNNQYILLLNNGSNANYYSEGFTSANQINTAITEAENLKAQVKEVVTDEVRKNPVNIITTVHNKLVEMFEYTYPSKDNKSVNNVYGALKTGKANCDGYARVFKWILDDYDIPNVMVAGVAVNAQYKTDGEAKVNATMGEAHAWNYVKLDGLWYAVDVTWDDPMPMASTKATDKIRNTYLLRGEATMKENHFAFGQFSPEGKEFTFPDLSRMDYDEKNKDLSGEEIFIDESTNLKVNVEGEFPDENNNFTFNKVTVNYLNMSLEELTAQGYFLSFRGTDALEGDIDVWQRVDDMPNNATGDDLFSFNIEVNGYLQFCITKTAPLDGEQNYLDYDLSLPGNNEVLTKWVKIPYSSGYIPKPFVRQSSPALSERVMPVKQTYRVEFDDKLELADINKSVDITVKNTTDGETPNLGVVSTIENIDYEYGEYTLPGGKKKTSTIVSFDFTPDTTFQGYGNIYNLQIENLVSKVRGVPNSFNIMTSYTPKLPCPIAVAQGAVPNAFLMSNPTLVVDPALEDIFTTNAGAHSYGSLNIALVATKVDKGDKEAADINTALSGTGINLNDENIKSNTYQLSIGCGSLAAAIRPGYHVSIGLPYPAGYNPKIDTDVEFRAYHFKLVNGVYVPEEIVCKITPAGLMVMTDNFSPFTVVAVPKAIADANPSQVVENAVTASLETAGGKIETENGGAGMYTIANGKSRTFTVTPDEGYEIDRIILNNVEVKLSDKTTYSTTFNYDPTVKDGDLKAYFVAKTVVEKEEEKGIEAIVPVLSDDSVIAPKPTFVERNLVSGVVAIKGVMAQDPNLTLSVAELTTEQTKVFTDYKPGATRVLSGTPALTDPDALMGDVSLTLTVNDIYAGHSLKLLTIEAGAVKEYAATAVNKTVKFDGVKGLVPFYLIDATVNTSTLENLITNGKLLVEENYTKVSYGHFIQILNQAEKYIKETSVSNIAQEAVKKFVDNLTNAQTALVSVVELKAEFTNFASLKKADYTQDSYKALEDKVKAAQGLLFNGTDTDVKAAIKDINELFTKLAAADIDIARSLLNETLTIAEGLKTASNYMSVLPTFRFHFEAKYDKAVVITNNASSTLAELRSANSELLKAMHMLSFTANKDDLNKLIIQCDALKPEDYVDDVNKAAYDSALKYAKEIADKEGVVDITIHQAYNALYAAKAKLTLVSEVPEPDVNVGELDTVLNLAADINKNADNYDTTGEAWKAYNTALQNAKTVDRKNAKAVKDVTIALNKAIANLRMLPTQAISDYMAAMIKKLQTLDLSKYSEKDQLFLINARIKAEAFAGATSFTKEEYAAIIETLANAQTVITENVLKPEEPKPTPNPDDPTPAPDKPNPNPSKPNEDPKDPDKQPDPENPTKPNEPAKTPAAPAKPNGVVRPGTGDSTNLPMAASAMSAAGLLGYIAYRRKRNKK